MIDQQPITLRPATIADAGRIASLFTDEGYPAATSTIAERIERFAPANGKVVVAEDDGEILGFVAVHAMPRFEHADAIVRVMALVVDAGFGSRGVGPTSDGRGRADRPRAGAAFVEVTAGHHRPDARHLYEALGYDATRRPPTSASGSEPTGPRHGGLRHSRASACATRRSPSSTLPWELPLAEWPRDRWRSASSRSGRRATSSGSSSSTASLYALKELPLDVARREYEVLLRLEAAGLPAVDADRHRRGAGPRQRDPRDRVPAALAPVPAAADAAAAGPGSLPRPAARRDGVPPRRPPSERRLLGRLLAREHAVPARRRPDPGLSRRRRDERGPSERCRTASARTTSRSSSRTSPSGWPTSPRCRSGPTTWTRRSRPPSSVRDRYRAPLGRAPRRAGPPRRRPPGDPRPGSAGSTTSASRSTRSSSTRRRATAASGCGCAVTTRRFHVRELERRTGIRALEGQARCSSTTSTSMGPGSSGARAARSIRPRGAERWLREVYRPTLARHRARPSARPATWSRRTATCSSRSGTCRRRAGATSGWQRAIDGVPGARGAGAGGRRRADDAASRPILDPIADGDVA